MKKILSVVLICIGLNTYAQFSNAVLFFGPKFNFNIGNSEHRFSGGVEISAWTFNNSQMPIGADFGLDFERDRCRIYGELQAGALLGLSAGPVLELTREGHAVGFQTSMWAAFFLGTDIRYRRINATNYFAPGFFFKVPVLQKGNYGVFNFG